MKMASITEAKNGLSALIDRVKRGATILIVDRGRPVARLEPVNELASDDASRLDRLVRDGLVRPARAATSRALITTAPPKPAKGSSVVRALLDERRDSR
jgi:prevent-host-death family protein